MNNIKIRMGAMSLKLQEQLSDQGFEFDEDDVELLQRLADGITLCYLHGTLTESEVGKARKRLMKKIQAAVTGRHKEEADGTQASD